MNRRTVLTGGAAASLSAVAGCLTGVFGDETAENAVLEPPEEELGEPTYPIYGDPFPEIELTDPLAESTVDVASLEGNCLLATAFFSSCPAECVPLMRAFATVQQESIELGLDDRTRFLAVTFDPERDTPEQLQDHAEMAGADLEAGNWHYLRPEDQAEAKAVVEDELGVPFEREDLGDDYDFTHITVTFLVNPDGYVERVYRGEDPDTIRIVDDLEAVHDAWE